MSITRFPHGISTYGMQLFPSLATQGNYYFVAPMTGNDGNTGLEISKPLKTLSKALTYATANQNDVIFLIAENNTAANTTDYQSTALTWNKDLVHLVGIGAPVMVSHRARIAQLSTATGISPLVNVTANGCIFHNVSLFHGVADATSLVCLQITGQRNVFDHVHVAGVGHATMVAANSASLKIDGGAENVFRKCVIGLDTIARDNNVAELWLDTAATRNMFEDCIFQGFISHAGYVHVKVNDATAIDRWMIFKNCGFVSESTNDATSQTSVFSIPAMSQGYIILENCYHLTPGASGTGDWDSNNRGRLYANMASPAATAGGGIVTKQ